MLNYRYFSCQNPNAQTILGHKAQYKSSFRLPSLLPDHWIKKPFGQDEINHLPTLLEIKRLLYKIEADYPVNREEMYSSIMSKDLVKHLGHDFICSNKSKFIFTRTAAAASLKPNITTSHFLYRGEKKDHGSCRANVYREETDLLEENIKQEEFKILLESHPLFQLLRNGIQLSDDVMLKIFNPYGIAQHYGFKTCVLDLTSDFEVASFFATTNYDKEKDGYELYYKEETYGALYVYHMQIPFSILSNNDGLTTIGLQPFPRSGAQKGFLWNCHSDFNSKNQSDRCLTESCFVTKIYFKHDKEINENIFKETNGGEALFPPDELSIKAKEILDSKEFSQQSFERNMEDNRQNDRKTNLNRLKDNGITISPKQPVIFGKDNLDIYYSRIHNGGWEDFCDQIVFPFENGGQLLAKLRGVINDPTYKAYFGY